MNNRWILTALVFSMAINVAVLGTLVYYWTHQDKREYTRPDFREPHPSKFDFGLNEEKRDRMRSAMKEYRLQILPISDSLRVRRQALIQIMLSGRTDQQVLDNILAELAAFQIELDRTTINHLMKMRTILDPDEWQHLVQAIENRMPHYGKRPFGDRPGFGRWRRFHKPDTMFQK